MFSLTLREKKNLSTNKSATSFIQQFNPETRTMEWQVVDDNYDYHQEIATSSYGDMLHDDERNKKFGAALKHAIVKVHSWGEKAHVLDIGTGTGLLAMLAVQHGADSVIACEMFLPVARCARKIIDANGFSGKIKVVAKHSTSLTVGPDGDLPRRANILVSEVFDTELIGEGALQTFNHAHEELLEDKCIVIPSVGTIYAQVIESKACSLWNKLEDFESDGKVLLKVPEIIKSCPGAPSLHDLQLSQLPLEDFKPISQPLPVFRFDFMRQKKIPNDEFVKKHFTALNSGTSHVIFMWWDLTMDDEDRILLSCAPVWYHPYASPVLPIGNPALDIPWRDHWMQAVYFLRREVHVTEKEDLILRASHDEFSLWFEMEDGEEENSPVCHCGFHLTTSRTRIGALNDFTRRSTYLTALKDIAKKKKYFIVLGDLSLLGMLAPRLGAKKVLCLSKPTLGKEAWKQLIIANNLENTVYLFHDIPSMVNHLKDDIDSHYIGENDICILGEPFFNTSLLAWQNVYFWSLKETILESLKPYAKRDCIAVFVKKLILRASCVQFDDLDKISRPLGKCMDIDMKEFDEMIFEAKTIAQTSPEPHPLWEYPCKAESEAITLISLDLEAPLPNTIASSTSYFSLANIPKIDGIAFWAEYELFNGAIVNTGPVKPIEIGHYIQWDRFERQGVHLFSHPPTKDPEKAIACAVQFIPKSAEFNFSISIGQINA